MRAIANLAVLATAICTLLVVTGATDGELICAAAGPVETTTANGICSSPAPGAAVHVARTLEKLPPCRGEPERLPVVVSAAEPRPSNRSTTVPSAPR